MTFILFVKKILRSLLILSEWEVVELDEARNKKQEHELQHVRPTSSKMTDNLRATNNEPRLASVLKENDNFQYIACRADRPRDNRYFLIIESTDGRTLGKSGGSQPVPSLGIDPAFFMEVHTYLGSKLGSKRRIQICSRKIDNPLKNYSKVRTN